MGHVRGFATRNTPPASTIVKTFATEQTGNAHLVNLAVQSTVYTPNVPDYVENHVHHVRKLVNQAVLIKDIVDCHVQCHVMSYHALDVVRKSSNVAISVHPSVASFVPRRRFVRSAPRRM